MKKAIIALCLGIEMILGGSGALYADDDPVKCNSEILSEEVDLQYNQQDESAEEDQKLMDFYYTGSSVNTNFDYVGEEQTEGTYSVALIKCEGGEICFSETMTDSEEVLTEDEAISELRRFEPETEIIMEIRPDEGFELVSLVAESCESEYRQYEICDSEYGLILIMPWEDIEVKAVFALSQSEYDEDDKVTSKDEEVAFYENIDTRDWNSESEIEKDEKHFGITDSEADSTTESSGIVGENLNWMLDDKGTLTIFGSGSIPDFNAASDVPWYPKNELISTLIIEDGATSTM